MPILYISKLLLKNEVEVKFSDFTYLQKCDPKNVCEPSLIEISPALRKLQTDVAK